jgi:hypothetical protein
VALNSGKVDKVKKIVEDSAMQREICEVYLHEFKRRPDREFNLTISDVVFFGLAGHNISVSEIED